MADGLPPLKVVFQADTDDLQRGLGLTAAQMEKLFGVFRKGEDETKKFAKEVDNLGTKFEKFAAGISAKAQQITASFLSFGTGGALTGVLKNVGELDKKMYGLSKTAAMTGQSFGAMSRGIDDLNAKTKLSIRDSTEFFKIVSEGTKGVRMTADQVSKLGQTLSQEFGPSLEDVTQAFQKLAQIQEKDVFLFRKIDDNMNAEKLGAYAARLVVLNKVSEDQLNTLFRTVYARTLGEKAQSVEQRRMMEYSRTVQEFNKIVQDISLNIGKELMPIFKELVPYVSKAAEKIASLVKEHPGIVKLAGALVLMGPAVGAIGKIGGGFASMARVTLGTRANPMITRSADPVPPGSGPGAMGAMGRLATGAGIIGMGQLGGSLAEGAGYGQAGSGMKAVGNIAGGAWAGSALGPWGAVIGGIGGFIASLDDLEEAFTGTKQKAAEAAKELEGSNKKKKVEAEAGRAKRVTEAEAEAGVGMDDTRFGTALMASRSVQQRLRAKGMSEADVKSETKSAAGGQASSAWLKEQRKVGLADIQAQIDVARKEIESLIPDDDEKKAEKVAEQVDLIAEKFEFIKAQAEVMSLRTFMMEAEQINELLGMITGSLKEQTAFELEFYGNAEKAQATIGKTIEFERQAVRLLTQKRDQTLEMVDSYGGMEAAQARALELQSQSGTLLPKERQELDSIVGSLAAIETQNKMIVSHNREIFTLERSRSEVYDQRLAVQQSELGLMESQAAMVKEMYLGAGPTLEFQMQQVQQLERMKSTVAANLKNAQADLKLQPERVDLQQKVNVLQQKQVDLTQKQLSLTKNLREGYLDAMTAMTNAEGTFSKFVLRKDMGMGEMQRNFMAAGGLRTGMVGAGAADPTMRWKPGGGPGALQYMGPDALKQLGSQYGEEYGPQQIFANMPNALAQTPLGQFGAQAPDSGATSMGGRGAGITIQNPQQAAEMQSIQREAEQRVKKGEGTQDLQARAAAIQKTAAGGTFEGQIVAKMDQIIGIMSGTKPVQDTKTTDAVAEGVKQGQAAVADKDEQKGRQEATKQAADMRRGTLEKGAPSAAEAAIKKQSDKLDESERLEQAKFEKYSKTFGDWDSVAKGVNTQFLGFGKQGGGGAQGVQYAGAGKGMTVAGAAFETPFTAEQIKAASKGPGAGAAGEAQREITIDDIAAQAGKIQTFFEKPGADLEAQIKAKQGVQSSEEDKQAELAAQLGEERYQQAAAAESAKGVKGGDVLRQSRNLEAEKEKLLKQFSAESVAKQEGLGGSGIEGMGGFLMTSLKKGAQESAKRGGMIMDAISGLAEDAFGSLIGEAETKAAGGKRFSQAAGDIYGELTKGDEKPGITTNQDAIYENIKRISKLQKDMEPAVKAAKEQEEQRLAFITEANTRAGNVAKLEKEMESSKKTSKDAAGNLADLEKQQADIAGQKAAAYAQLLGLTEDQGKQMTEQESDMKESKIFFEGTELQKSQTEYSREMDELTKGIEKRRKMVDLLTPMAGDADAQKQIEENQAAINAMLEKQNALEQKGAAPGMAQGVYDENGKLVDTGGRSKGVYDENGKLVEGIKAVNESIKEGATQQANASKEAGQNIKSSLEQQKIDVTPVVTAVNPACATAVAQAKSAGGWIAHMAGGGRLPGFGGGDRVLAMLEPGEMVINKNSAAAFPGLLEQINNNRYANGGTVGMLPSPAMARAGGTIMPRFNISVRGDTAKTLVDSVGNQLSGLLNDMFTPQGTSGRLYDLGS